MWVSIVEFPLIMRACSRSVHCRFREFQLVLKRYPPSKEHHDLYDFIMQNIVDYAAVSIARDRSATLY